MTSVKKCVKYQTCYFWKALKKYSCKNAKKKKKITEFAKLNARIASCSFTEKCVILSANLSAKIMTVFKRFPQKMPPH